MTGPTSPKMIDLEEFVQGTAFLEPKALKAYLKLLCHYWRHGKLFPSDRGLAAVCELSAHAFKPIKEQIEVLFVVDDQGLWRDYALEKQRAAAMNERVSKSDAGKKGAAVRYGKSAAADDSPIDPISAIAPAMADAIAETPEIDLFPMADAMANAMAPLASHGSIDRSFIESKEEIDRSIDARDAPAKEPFAIANAMANGMADAMANGMANAMANGIEESAAKPSATAGEVEAEVLPLAQAVAKAVTAPVSINGRGPALGLPAAPPAAAAPSSAVDAGPSDQDLFRLLRKACGTNVRETLFHRKAILPIRELIRDGYDLDGEILPTLADRVPHLAQPLRTFSAGFIREALDEARQAAPKRPVQPQAASARQVFVAFGTPQWRAWDEYFKSEGKKPYPKLDLGKRFGDRFGNMFEAAWPPGYEPSTSVAAQ